MVVLGGRNDGYRYTFEQDIVTVGRDRTQDMVLLDPSVSRTHFRIRFTVEGFLLRDLESANGTLLNGRWLDNETGLSNGDKIEAGRFRFRFESGACQEVSTAPTKSGKSRPPRLATSSTGGASPIPKSRSTKSGVAGKTGGLKQRWLVLDRKLRVTILAVTAIMVIAVTLKVITRKGREETPSATAPHDTILIKYNASISRKIYGLGPHDKQHAKAVQIRFPFTGGRLTLSYSAWNLAHEKELGIRVNNQHVAHGPVCPQRWEPLSLRIPRSILKRDSSNILSFINYDNIGKRKNKFWEITDIQLSENPLPPPNPEKADKQLKLGLAFYQARKVAPANLYKAWKHLQASMDLVELMANKPPFYQDAQDHVMVIDRMLQKAYNGCIAGVNRQIRVNRPSMARELLQRCLQQFPALNSTRRRRLEKLMRGPYGR